METNTKKNKDKYIKWDTTQSTYYWTMNLDPNYMGPVPNKVPALTGYSKKEFQSENTDKTLLLKRKIINLFNNGYFDRSLNIEWYKNTGIYINKKLDPLILITYKDYYKIPPLNHDYIYKTFGPFLDQFYHRIKTGLPLDGLLPKVKKQVQSLDYYLDINNYEFKNPGQVYTHARDLSKNGHPPGACTKFITDYLLKKGWQ